MTLIVPIPAFVVPFFGPLVGLLTPIVAGGIGRRVWPVRRWVAVVAGVAVVVQWLSFVVASLAWGSSDPVGFLLVPLCAPTGTAWLLAPLTATATYLVVASLSIRMRAIWLWPIAAAIGGVTMAAVFAALDDADLLGWVC